MWSNTTLSGNQAPSSCVQTPRRVKHIKEIFLLNEGDEQKKLNPVALCENISLMMLKEKSDVIRTKDSLKL